MKEEVHIVKWVTKSNNIIVNVYKKYNDAKTFVKKANADIPKWKKLMMGTNTPYRILSYPLQ